MKSKHKWLLVALLWCVAIFMTTAAPASTGGSTLSFIEKFFGLSTEQASFFNSLFRKFVHFTAFGIAAILFYFSFEKRRLLLAWSLATLNGAIDEIHQAFLPDRTASIIDVGIDSLGALIALIFIVIGKRLMKG